MDLLAWDIDVKHYGHKLLSQMIIDEFDKSILKDLSTSKNKLLTTSGSYSYSSISLPLIKVFSAGFLYWIGTISM